MLFSDIRLLFKYRRFSSLVGSFDAGSLPLPSFEEICSRLRVAPAELDRLLQEELGMSGEACLAELEKRLGK